MSVVVLLLLGTLPAAELGAFWGLIDAVVTRAEWRTMGLWLAATGAIIIIEPVLSRLLVLLQTRLLRGAQYHLTSLLLERAARTPLMAFESPDFFNLYTRASQGVREHMFETVDVTLGLVRTSVAVIAVLGTLFAIDWQATSVLLVAGVPAWAIQSRSATAWGALMRGQVPRARYLDYLGELLVKRDYAQEIRLFGTARVLLERWWQDRFQLGRERNMFALRRGSLQVVTLGLGNVAYVGALGILGFGVLAGQRSLGAFAGAFEAARDLQMRILGLMMSLGQLRQAGYFVSDVWAFLDGPGALPEVSGSGAGASVAADRADVTFTGVTFGYPGKAAPVLQDVNFTVRHGELIALVGENRAGKSTLVKLLLGLYQPTAGSVQIGGVEIASPDGAAARSTIASVFQEFMRYSLTVGENIAVGDISQLGNQRQIAAAAAGSGADQVTHGLPKGYDTQLGKEFEDGQELSGGQWQKLAIARAYMRQAVLLVLDEPTAALDPLAEVEVFQRFRELARGRTAFFISHRLGAARLADRILVLKDGRLVEDGRHDQLMAQHGEYAALFGAQAAWYADQPADRHAS
jgi:ABC-type multidrug transport system fused ATPase/permease subunit